MKVKFYLDSKTSNAGDNTIWCYVREFDNTLALNTGERIKLELWDKNLCRANLRKTKDKILKGSLKNLNQYLNAFEAKIFDVTRSVRGKEFNAGFTKVADEIKKQFDKREITLLTVYDEFLIAKSIKVAKSTIQKFQRVRYLLEDYQKKNKTKLTFEMVTKLFLEKFYLFLITDKNMLDSTAYKNIKFLKTYINWANESGYTDNTKHKSFQIKNEDSEIIYLTESELMKLYSMDINNERLERVRDLFVFQCFTGVRHSDIHKISREDINGATWRVRTQKTHQIIAIPLSNLALSILAKYIDYPQPLPVISNQKMNTYIKELCEIAGIDEAVKVVKYKGGERIEATHKKYEVIGTHTARRTFISLSLQKGMQAEVIMAITGHKTYKMMQGYLEIADSHKRDEMDKTWGSPLRKI